MSRKPISKEIRERVRSRFDGRCGYCGEKPEKLQIDHINPVAHKYRFGEEYDYNDESNLMPACFSCNNYKTTMTLEIFRNMLKDQANMGRRYSVNFRLAERFGLIQVTQKPIIFYFEKTRASEREKE